jgi:hypothetical protein
MNRKWLLIFFCIVVTVGISAFVGIPERRVPEVLQGHWITDDPRYENCFLQIGEDYIDIGTIAGQGVFGVVTAIKTDTHEDYINYVITYQDFLGLESILSFRYEPSSEGILRFANQQNMSWRRTSTLTP